MLNKDGKRELAYVVKIDDVKEIPKYDRVEYARVGGWWVIVRKGQFIPGDLAIYFEVDSLVPDEEPFLFLEKRKFRIKTLKMCGVVSQGLLMGFDDFVNDDGSQPFWLKEIKSVADITDVTGTFLTDKIGVKYYEPADEERKNPKPVDPGKLLMQRKAAMFKKSKFARLMMRYKFTRKIMVFIFGRKTKKSTTSFPTHFPYIHVSDEERIENCPQMLSYKEPLIATEKLDGTSTLFVLERKKRKKFEFYVVSRHVRQLTPDQNCYHDDNIYWNMAFKYDVRKHLEDYLNDNPNLTYVGLQGESVGSVQGNPLNLKEDEFYGYNFIRSDVGRISSLEGKKILEGWGMKWVPILKTDWVNPDTMEEMKSLATGYSVVNPEVLREGVVYRSEKDNTISFKNVSNEYLLKHNS